MYCLKAIPYLLLALFGCFSSPADAQINLKTGYNFSIISNNNSLGDIIDAYNASRSYESGFGQLNWLHGFEAGLRLKSELHALELTYQGGYQTLKATYPGMTETLTDRMKFGIHALGLGYQVSDDIWGLGADLQYQLYKTRLLPAETSGDFKDVQNMLALKFYLMLTLRGGKGSDMAIQPYYLLPLKGYDYGPLAERLQVDAPSGTERWTRFGITILFYNGQK